MPMYVAPEQLMKDRAEYARKGIARGRSVVVAHYVDGIVFIADNPSRSLHKISEIYDRIGFAGVGRYHEFESFRISGIRYADLRGYSYDRRDVQARGLAQMFAQQLGLAFSSAGDKPIEVELVVAQVGEDAASDEIYQISFDGTITDIPGLAVIGGQAETLREALSGVITSSMSCDEVVSTVANAMSDHANLEVAVLDRTSPRRRTFRRVSRPATDGAHG